MTADLFSKGKGFPFDHISPSFISKYESCPLAALYYREGKPKQWDPRYAEVGRYTHSVIEREYNPNAEIHEPECGWDDEMRTRHACAMKGYRELVSQDQRFLPVFGRDDIKQIPEHPIRIEIAGVPLVGIIDLLTRIGTRRVHIDDWKTGLPRPPDEQQLRIYTRAVSEILDVPPCDIVATLCYLRNDFDHLLKRVPFTSVEAVDHHIITRVIEPICDLQFAPNRGKGCSRCEYRHMCEAW